MSKLHEVLAVEGELAGVFKNILQETSTTFDKKPDHFQGHDKTLEMFAAERKAEEVTEHKEVTETVPSKLAYMFGHVVRFIDCNLQKESANQIALADVVVTDEVTGVTTTIGTNLPATFLLGLETKLKLVRDVLQTIPTVPPGFTWTPESNAEKSGLWRRNEIEVRQKTEKVVKPVVLYPATDKHPAQVKELSEDVQVGKFTTVHYNGMLTPLDKSRLLGRIDALARAVKQARQRANSVEVPQAAVGKAIQDFILG